MKKGYLWILLVVSVFTASYRAYASQSNHGLSEIAQANIEALASEDRGVNCCTSDNCQGEFCGWFIPKIEENQNEPIIIPLYYYEKLI